MSKLLIKTIWTSRGRLKRQILLISLLLSFSTAALGGTDYFCIGTIDQIATRASGGIAIISEEMYGDLAGRDICSLIVDWKGVAPDTCKSWLTKALMAQVSGKKLFIQYVDGLTCPTQPTWSSASSPFAIFIK